MVINYSLKILLNLSIQYCKIIKKSAKDNIKISITQN